MNARIIILLLALSAARAFAQGTFQNLNFEAATIVPAYPGGVYFGPAFPGWIGYTGTQEVNSASYPDPNAGSAGITLLGSDTFNGTRIAGNYTAVLQSGVGAGGSGFLVNASLAQSGLVPIGTRSLHFLAADDFRGGMITLVNGQPLNILPLQSFSGYGEYGADISQYAGQNVELRFVRPYISGGANLFLDDISFSPNAVPEPSTLSLLSLGALLGYYLLRQRGRKRSQIPFPRPD